jgi:hypothetical protein
VRSTWRCAGVLLLVSASSSDWTTFREVTARQTSISWVHANGHSDHRYLPETIGPGVGILDYNNDGWMDIFFLNSGDSDFFHPPKPLAHALYRNNRDGTFTDVTKEAGITADLFGMGIAIGDYDGDGFPDIFLTGYGKSTLYHNNRDGTFTDVTSQSGIELQGWSSGAVWFDYNNDGKLDLFVAQFADYSSLKTCGAENAYGGKLETIGPSQSFYCYPKIFPPAPSHLYRNDGHGHFTDVSKQIGLMDHPGKSWGAVATDVNNDGYLDLFVANDTMPNFLFLNQGGNRFEEVGLEAGVAYSGDGGTRSGMGVDSADLEGTGRQDLVVSNLSNETFSLYHNRGDGGFDDISVKSGIADATRLFTGWGLHFFDYDNDGCLDLVLANGHPDDLIDVRMFNISYRQTPVLLHGDCHGQFQNVSRSSGRPFRAPLSARGLATGDLNNDGYPDLVIGVNGGAPLLLYNNAESRNNWVGLKLHGTTANPDAIGAIIKWSINGVLHSYFKTAGGSFLSSHDQRDIIGMGKATRLDWLEIHWPRPSVRVDHLEKVPINQYLTVTEGMGMVR